MPSLAFWKTAKAEEQSASPAGEDQSVPQSNGTQATSLNFDPGNQESGVFQLDEMGNLVLVPAAAVAPQEERSNVVEEGTHTTDIVSESTVDHSMTEDIASVNETSEPPSVASSPASVDTTPSSIASPVECVAPAEQEVATPHVQVESASAPIVAHTSPLPSSSPSRTMSTPRRDSTSRRLHRPTELNLSNTSQDGTKPKSELEKRFDMMRNSKSQSKAALRSPTELLRERLNLSPKKSKHTEEIRVFVPPKLSTSGCILPGPGAQMEAFTSASVRAFTEVSRRPAWWCKTDKLVVFDGFEQQYNGEVKAMTRTSKGLSIARRRGDTETILIPMDCSHCQEMLNRQEWKYDIQVCKRNVCWDCKERCKWEAEQEIMARTDQNMLKLEGNRQRADSVLQDDDERDEDMMHKIGIEQARPRSPIEVVGGIAERLGNA